MLVLDFDGTLTDAEKEGLPFRVGYLEDLATVVGAPLEEVRALADDFEEAILRDRATFGWIFHGHIVAPASVDPYLRIMPVARQVMDHYGVLKDERLRERLLDGILYRYNYPKSAMHFRDGALEVLQALRTLDTVIISNSATAPVQGKIRALAATGGDPEALDWLVDRVYGLGKKYVVDPAFEAVPEALEIPDLHRPVLLRRPHYHRRITEQLAQRGEGWEDLCVVGDIFELDLALPLALGARVGLMVNDFTPPYEIAWLGDRPGARILRSLDDLLAFARS